MSNWQQEGTPSVTLTAEDVVTRWLAPRGSNNEGVSHDWTHDGKKLCLRGQALGEHYIRGGVSGLFRRSPARDITLVISSMPNGGSPLSRVIKATSSRSGEIVQVPVVNVKRTEAHQANEHHLKKVAEWALRHLVDTRVPFKQREVFISAYLAVEGNRKFYAEAFNLPKPTLLCGESLSGYVQENDPRLFSLAALEGKQGAFNMQSYTSAGTVLHMVY